MLSIAFEHCNGSCEATDSRTNILEIIIVRLKLLSPSVCVLIVLSSNYFSSFEIQPLPVIVYSLSSQLEEYATLPANLECIPSFISPLLFGFFLAVFLAQAYAVALHELIRE